MRPNLYQPSAFRRQPPAFRRQHGAVQFFLLVCIVLAGLGGSLMVFAFSQSAPSQSTPDDSIHRENSDSSSKDADEAPNSGGRFEVVIPRPAGPPRVETGQTDVRGNAITVACATCHATRSPNLTNKTSADLDEFHGQLRLAHGQITCLSCHNSKDYDALKLADETRVEFADVMTLCAQCHSPQMKDYQHGLHGGMSGHWDLSRGGQTRLNCTQCHDPHQPKFPKMQPTFKPRDRFLESAEH